MKYIYSLIFVLSVSINAQDYEPKYEVDANKAEYYVGTFNDNKDVDDLTAWYGKFSKWAESKDGTYDNMTVAILQPYFHSELDEVEVLWVNTWPTPSEQFNGLETWITGGGAKLLESLSKSMPVDCKDATFTILGVSLAAINTLLSILIIIISIRTLSYEKN